MSPPTSATVLAAAHAHGPGKRVEVSGGWRRPARPRPPGVPLSGLDAAGPDGRLLRAVLDTALAPRRWEPWAEHNDHRAFPSARASHLHDAALALPGHPVARVIDPVRGLLAGARPVAVDGPWPAQVKLSAVPQRLRPGYGALRDAIALLEVGHVLGALAEAAAALGVAAAPRLHRAALAAAATGAPAGPVATLVLGPTTHPTWPRRRVDAVRSSGLGPRGLSPDPRPWAAGALDALAAEALLAPPGSPTAATPLRHHLLVRPGAAGGTGGVHAPCAEGAHRTGPAPAGDALRALFPVAPDQLDVAALDVVWVITAEVAGAVAAGGPSAYPTLLLAAGAAAQHVGSAAAAAGLFCRPVRGVDECGLEAAVGAGPAEDVVYTLLIGRPRLPALGYDLTDPHPPGGPP